MNIDVLSMVQQSKTQNSYIVDNIYIYDNIYVYT